MLADVALPAERDVGLYSSNQLDLVNEASSEGEASISRAHFADSLQFLNFLCFGNQIDDVVKACSQVSAVQSWDNNHFAFAWGFLRELNDLKIR